jgi:drug/metabolite transporter (DMT)-like permease
VNWVLLVLLSAVFFAAANIIRKHVLSKEHPLEFLAARGFFTILLLLLFAPFVNFGLGWRALGLIYFASAIASVGYYYQTKAQRKTDISYLSPLQNLSPLVLVFLAFLFLNEQLEAVQLLGVLAIVFGSYTVTVSATGNILAPLRELKKDYWAHIAISVVFLAVAVLLDKYLLLSIDPVTYLFFAWLFMNLNYLVLDWVLYDWAHIAVDLRKGWHWLFLSAAFSVVSMWCFYTALSWPGVLVSLAFPLRRVSSVIETLFGGSIFKEKNLPLRLFSCLIMIVGVVLVIS